MNANEILQLFVANNQDSRLFMQAPILRGEWIYATNGHVAVRVPKQDAIDARETDKIPGMAALFDNNRRTDISALPQLPDASKCYACGGKGYAITCSDCDGEGWFDHGRHKYTCQECDGSGQAPAEDEGGSVPCCGCGGYGKAKTPFDIGVQAFDLRYLARIKSLPCAMFSSAQEEFGAGYFTFNGGEGIIMPMRK